MSRLEGVRIVSRMNREPPFFPRRRKTKMQDLHHETSNMMRAAAAANHQEQLDIDDLRKKLKEYAVFIDQTLHPELKKAVSAREDVESEIDEYMELRDKLAVMQQRKEEEEEEAKPLESLVDLGNKMAYCRAIVEDPKTIFVHIGMGFHAEFTQEEANAFIDKRIKYLEEQVLSRRLMKAKQVAAHLESSLVILETLAKELKEVEESA